jgi:Fe-S cluster biogenesis protein NfuA
VSGDPAEEAAREVDRLLAELREGADPAAAAAAEELTGCLVRLYGDGLARIAAMLGPQPLTELCADPLVANLLLIHDLHPVPAAERIRQALAGTGAELLGLDDGVARLRLPAGGSRCGSARQGAQRDVEAAVRRAAPEVSEVAVEVPAAPPPLLQVTLRPGLAALRH